MKQALVRWTAAIVLASVSVMPAVGAQEGQKALPTLLIKGEVVSVDVSDLAATLLKVKDRYGFETPIYLTQETTISQGEQMLTTTDLSAGTPVEVEYNFDINTAKRHAVNVTVHKPPAEASTPPAGAEAPTVEPVPVTQAAPTGEPAPAAASSSQAAPAEPAAPPASAVTSEQPAGPATTQ